MVCPQLKKTCVYDFPLASFNSFVIHVTSRKYYPDVFFQECIITALRSGNKECPTCRKKLVSKRSLRPDPNFDTLISKIYPSRDEYEQHQERVMARLNRNHNHASLVSSIEEGIKLQSQSRQKTKHKGPGEDIPLIGAGMNNLAISSSTNAHSTSNNSSSTSNTTSLAATTNHMSTSAIAASCTPSATTPSNSIPSSSPATLTQHSAGPKVKRPRVAPPSAPLTSENESGGGSSVEGSNMGDDGDQGITSALNDVDPKYFRVQCT